LPRWLALAASLACAALADPSPAAGWTTLATGIEYRTFQVALEDDAGVGVLHVVRVDPALTTLDLGLASQAGEEPRTAAAWADRRRYTVAINAGMYLPGEPGKNVGHLRHGAHVNQARWNDYQSVLAFGPTDGGVPPAALLDRDEPGFEAAQRQYASAVQNLRLIKGPKESRWVPQGRRWSEAMIAADRQGRLVLLFSRAPFEMATLNARVLALPLDLVRAMHAEGGPEASLSIRGKGLSLDLAGSFETGFSPDDSNAAQWRIPNVLGIRPR
jgi:hypothetical protein